MVTDNFHLLVTTTQTTYAVLYWEVFIKVCITWTTLVYYPKWIIYMLHFTSSIIKPLLGSGFSWKGPVCVFIYWTFLS